MGDQSPASPFWYIPLMAAGAAAVISAAAAIAVAYLNALNNRRFERTKRSHEFNKFKLEQIQESVDNILRPNEELLTDVLAGNRKIAIDFYNRYLGNLDFYWERAEHYCIHAKKEWIVDARRYRKDWPKKLKACIDENSDASFQAFAKSCHAYKKCVASILIHEARMIVEDGS